MCQFISENSIKWFYKYKSNLSPTCVCLHTQPSTHLFSPLQQKRFEKEDTFTMQTLQVRATVFPPRWQYGLSQEYVLSSGYLQKGIYLSHFLVIGCSYIVFDDLLLGFLLIHKTKSSWVKIKGQLIKQIDLPYLLLNSCVYLTLH